MSDLISRSELLKRLEEWNTSDETDRALYNFALHRIIEQPTAYSVDKVVEQLNNAKKYNLDLADKMLDIQANGTTRHFICLEDAIEIVKAGVKNE